MKKIIIVFLSILLIIFLSLVYITKDRSKNIEKLIKENYADIDLYYTNEYNNYYIFISDKNYGVLDNKFNEVLLVDKTKVHKNKNNYNIIYRNNTLMYEEEILKKKKLIFNYYDIYTYKLIESISLGG